MITRKFWPLDYDPEGEIYENLAWDLPGFRRSNSRPVSRRKHVDAAKLPASRRRTKA